MSSDMRELQASGTVNANDPRAHGLSGKRGFARMLEAYEAYREGGRIPATFEIVYGHAWRPERETRLTGGEAVIEFHPRPRQAGGR